MKTPFFSQPQAEAVQRPEPMQTPIEGEPRIKRRNLIFSFDLSAMLASAIVLATVFGFGNGAFAQSSYTWTGGGGDNNFGTGANWGGTAPGSLQSYLNFSGSTRPTPNNNYGDYAGGFQIYFNSGASVPFTITGNHIKFFDYNSVAPNIQNDSTSLQTINFGFGSESLGYNMNITASSGNMAFGTSFSYFDDAGVYLAVHANNSHTVTFNGAIGNGSANANFSLDGGGICVFNANNTYTGQSQINAGELQITSSGVIASGSAIYLGLGTTANSDQITLTGNGSQSFANSFTVNTTSGGSDHTKRIIASSNTSGNDTYSGTITLNSDVSLNAENSAGTLTFSGEVGVNAFNAYATGPGTVALNGSVDNVNLGLTVNSGTVVLGKTGSGHHAVGTSATVNSGGTLQLGSGGNSDQIYDGAGVTVSSGGAFDLNGQTETINSISLNGTGISGQGALTNSSASAATLTLNNASSLAGATTVGGTGDIAISGGGAITMGSPQTLTKIGNNKLTLSSGSADNVNLLLTASAGTVVLNKTTSSTAHCIGGLTVNSGGTVQLSGSGGYEIYQGATPTVNSGGVLDLNGQNQTFTSAGPTISGTGISGGGALINSSSTASTLASPVTLGASSSVGGNGSGGLTISGVISGSSSGYAVTKVGSGTVILQSANTYSGNTAISGGTLALSGSGSILSSLTKSVATGATFDVSAITPSGYSLNSSGAWTFGINKTGMTDTQGQLALGAKNLTYGGTLTVAATGDVLATGDSFTLVTTNTGATFSGWFSSVSVPALASGISWDTNKLATTGILDIYSFTTTALALSTPTNTAAVISASKLANHASSGRAASAYPTGWKATVTTPSHGTASVDGSGILTYTPTTGYSGSDSFTLTFQDGHGWQTMAVSVTVGSGSGESPNVVYGPTTTGGNFVVRFAGIPGDTYTVEKASSMSPPVWAKYANYTAPSDNTQGFGIGVFQVSEPTTDSGSGYYRTVYPSY
jgi:autotransporter-associated beta strand protein